LGFPTPDRGRAARVTRRARFFAAAKASGRRPRKDFCEPLLVAASVAIYAGFTPAKIADVEKWMADGLSANGHEAGEVAIRKRARARTTSARAATHVLI